MAGTTASAVVSILMVLEMALVPLAQLDLPEPWPATWPYHLAVDDGGANATSRERRFRSGEWLMLTALIYRLIYGTVLAHYYNHMLKPVCVVAQDRLERNQRPAS